MCWGWGTIISFCNVLHVYSQCIYVRFNWLFTISIVLPKCKLIIKFYIDFPFILFHKDRLDQNSEYCSTFVIHLYWFCSVFELENQLVTSGRPSPCPFWHLLCQCHSCGPCHINQCQLCVPEVFSWLSSQKPNFEAIVRITLRFFVEPNRYDMVWFSHKYQEYFLVQKC